MPTNHVKRFLGYFVRKFQPIHSSTQFVVMPGSFKGLSAKQTENRIFLEGNTQRSPTGLFEIGFNYSHGLIRN